MKLWLALAAFNGFIAVMAGAFAAHGLEGRVAERALAAFETGARYHMFHALALIAVAWLTSQSAISQASVTLAGWAFLAGILLFSGTLYVYGLTESRALVMLTPVGGVAFLIGWAALFWTTVRFKA